MSFKPFQKLIVVGDFLNDLPRVLNQLQENIARCLNPILKDPFLDGQIIENVTLNVGTNVINHQLGRAPQGYIIVSQDGSGTVFSQQKTNSSPNLTLILNSSSSMTISLRIF